MSEMTEAEQLRARVADRIQNGFSEEEAERRAQLEAVYGENNVWNTKELERDFVVEGFAAPIVVVRRRSDNARGTLFFAHMPRFYFNFSLV